MILSLSFVCFLQLLSLLYFQNVNINYNITLLKLQNDECDSKEDNYIFEIKCIINPSPIFDLEFDLDLNTPSGSSAKCKLMDDVIDTLKCYISTKNHTFMKETISISGNKLIKVNDQLNIHIENVNQRWVVDFCNFYIPYINIYILVFVLILEII